MNRRNYFLGGRRGIALVVTLSALVLLTMLALAFFARSQANRQLAFSSASLVRTELLAQTALDIITGELRQEIADGANSQKFNGGNAQWPPVFEPLTMVTPEKTGVNAPDQTGTLTLVKVSLAGRGLYGSGSAVCGSAVGIDEPGASGRRVSREQWFGRGGPQLGGQAALPVWLYLTRGGEAKSPELAEARDADSEDCVAGRFAFTVYDTGGLLDANIAGSPILSGSSPAVAGGGSQAGVDLRGLRDAGNNPLFDTPGNNNFTTWRSGSAWLSGSGATPEEKYNNWLLEQGTRRGFLETAAGQNIFLSRAELLRASASGSLLPQDAGKYFTVFSRAVNAPSWGPRKNSTALDGYDVSGGKNCGGEDAADLYAYHDKAGLTASVNRFIPDVRFRNSGTVTHYNDDGVAEPCAVRAGDPSVQRRFSLAKLGWLTFSGPKNGIDGDAIRACFGLEWDAANSRWNYTELDTNGTPAIKTLEQIAGEMREPNFFELLNAGILHGSVGQHPGDLAGVHSSEGAYNLAIRFGPNGAGSRGYSGNTARHILQIGANIIDQYSTGNYPTLIYPQVAGAGAADDDVAQDIVAGQKNLPYLQRFHCLVYEDPNTGVANSGTGRYLQFIVLPELWNISRPAADAGAPGPVEFRVRAYGGLLPTWQLENFGYTAPNGSIGENNKGVVYDANNPDRFLYFHDTPGSAASAFFKTPGLIRSAADPVKNLPGNMTPADLAASGTNNYKPASISAASFFPYDNNTTPGDAYREHPYAGIYAGRANYYRRYSNNTAEVNRYNTATYVNILLRADYTFSLVLECKDAAGHWRPYSTMHRFNTMIGGNLNIKYHRDAGAAAWDLSNGSLYKFKDRAFGHTPDPRTDRFSMTQRRSNWWGPETSYQSTMSSQQSSEFDYFGAFPDSGNTGFRYLTASGLVASATACTNKSVCLWTLLVNDTAQAAKSAQQASSQGGGAYYADPDGVVRPADGFRQSGGGSVTNTSGDGYYLPHYDQNTASRDRRRPVILSRPFKSVAEMGYAFRDLPGRNLDFWSAKSADAALLDLFCLNDEPTVSAGKLNLNSLAESTVTAMLSGAEVDVSGSVRFDAAQAKAVAAAVSAWLQDSGKERLGNPADLVWQLADTVSDSLIGSASVQPANNALPFRANKAWAETPVRALSSLGQTRAWNLLVDVVAQSGRLAPNAGSLADFIVEGEQRYWLHLAIDRYTGKIIDRQLEPAR